MPAVSVIVPVYNVEKYLRRCLDSILAQTFRDFELILVDDGSTDSCGNICDEYAAIDSRITVFHKQNGGVSSARNLGMEAARGDYIMFCDGDDVVHPRWCEIMHSAAEKNKNTMCVCKLEKGKTLDFKEIGEEVRFYPISYFDLFKNGSSPYVVNKIYNRTELHGNGIQFDQDVAISEDVLFNSEYIKNCNGIVYTDEVLYFYFDNPQSAMNQTRVYWQKQPFLAFSCRLPLIEPKDLPAYCDFWLYCFIEILKETFDERNTMSFMQKMRYNQKMMNASEFRFCVSHASGKRENPMFMAILRLHNYYLLWVFEKTVNLKKIRFETWKQK